MNSSSSELFLTTSLLSREDIGLWTTFIWKYQSINIFKKQLMSSTIFQCIIFYIDMEKYATLNIFELPFSEPLPAWLMSEVWKLNLKHHKITFSIDLTAWSESILFFLLSYVMYNTSQVQCCKNILKYSYNSQRDLGVLNDSFLHQCDSTKIWQKKGREKTPLLQVRFNYWWFHREIPQVLLAARLKPSSRCVFF